MEQKRNQFIAISEMCHCQADTATRPELAQHGPARPNHLPTWSLAVWHGTSLEIAGNLAKLGCLDGRAYYKQGFSQNWTYGMSADAE